MNGVTPNKENQERHTRIREMGCIVCILEGMGNTPPQIHHPKGCKTQEAHSLAIGLCFCHHMADQQMPPDPRYTSRHPNKKQFERRYGTEEYLLEKTNELLTERV